MEDKAKQPTDVSQTHPAVNERTDNVSASAMKFYTVEEAAKHIHSSLSPNFIRTEINHKKYLRSSWDADITSPNQN